MKTSWRKGWCIPIGFFCTAALALSLLGPIDAFPAAAAVGEKQFVGATSADVPLSLFQTYQGTYGVAHAGKATARKEGSATFTLPIPGTPVAAFLYLAGTDVRTDPGKHFPAGDAAVHVVVSNAGGGATFDLVPVQHRAGRSFLNRLDITAAVVEGDNEIRVSKYNLNHPEGAFAVAVYSSPALERTRVDLFDGADRAWYPRKPPLGPDTEAVISVFDAYPLGERAGSVVLVTGGAEKDRGDEVFLFTGAGDPAALIPDSDGDGLPDVVDRRWKLTRKDGAPLGNDPADGKGHLEAVAGAVSLEEDRLGGLRKNRGTSLGPELDLMAKAYTIPAGHDFAAFQVQTEDPEAGDSLTLYALVNSLAAPEGFNPLPNIGVTKTPKSVQGLPGLRVDYTFTVTAAGGDEALAGVSVTDEPELDIVGPDPGGDADGDGLLDPGESWVYHAAAEFTEPGSYPDLVTARAAGAGSGIPVEDSDDALVVVSAPQPGSIGGVLWSDLDGDGARGAGEPGIAGVELILVKPGGSTSFGATDGSGAYRFAGLEPGGYEVHVNPATLPAGAVPTGDPDGAGTPHEAALAIVSGEDDLAVDFGYFVPPEPGSIGGLVWADFDGDGARDGFEPGIAGVELILVKPGGSTSFGSTDGSGAYRFAGLEPGGYEVHVNPATLPAGAVPTGDYDGAGTPHEAALAIVSGEDDLAVDFAYFVPPLPGSVGGVVWSDLDGDGARGAGEPGLAGVELILVKPGGSTAFATTDAGGAYRFAGLGPGGHEVHVNPATLPAGAVPTGDYDGVGTPHEAAIMLFAGDDADGIDFGYLLDGQPPGIKAIAGGFHR